MSSQEVLEMVARGMVAAGVYKDINTAIKAVALEQVERKIAHYTSQIQDFERKYQHGLEEHSRLLELHWRSWNASLRR
jgi:ribulose kinase